MKSGVPPGGGGRTRRALTVPIAGVLFLKECFLLEIARSPAQSQRKQDPGYCKTSLMYDTWRCLLSCRAFTVNMTERAFSIQSGSSLTPNR